LHRSCVEKHELRAALGFPYIFKHIVCLLSVGASDLDVNPTRVDGNAEASPFIFSRDITKVPKEET
jgi:hypothetical protein